MRRGKPTHTIVPVILPPLKRKCNLDSTQAPKWIILVALLLRVFGKGIVMRFNPILFQQVYNLSPTTLTAVALSAQVLSIGSPIACLHVGDRIGRANTIVLVRLIEPLALLAMVFSHNQYAAAASFVVFLGVPVGTRALEKALLMDYTPRKSRGRWNALEAVNRATWAGSASLGGYLIYHGSWELAYAASAGFTGAAVVVLSPLIFLVRQ